MITIALLIVLISLLVFVLHWAIQVNRTWKKRGIKHRTPCLFLGNMFGILAQRKHISTLYEEICREFRNEPIIGFYDFIKPCLLIQDADYIEKVLIKDFVHFIDHGFSLNEEKNPIDAQLFSMVGKRWRAFRYKLSPIFTSGKLKNMFESMMDCGDDLEKKLHKSNKLELNLKTLMSQFTIDVVGSSIFGIQPKALQNPNTKFCKLATDFWDFGFFGSLKIMFMTITPFLSGKLGLSFNNPEAVDYFCKIISDTFEYRKKNNIQRQDFIQLLMDLKEKKKIEIRNWDPNDDYLKDSALPGNYDSYEITDNILMAQAYSFLANGLDGMALTQAYAFLELSTNPKVQEKAREEILEQINQHQGLTYAALKNMIYLENVVKETLRIHPAGPHLFRICTKEYTFPNGFNVQEGDVVRIPLDAVHKNPNYFPEPNSFKPERFDIPPKSGTYLPFGDGPRVCIAIRYALLLVKYGIAKVLSKYNVKLNPKTKLPVTIKSTSLINSPQQPLLFDLEEIS